MGRCVVLLYVVLLCVAAACGPPSGESGAAAASAGAAPADSETPNGSRVEAVEPGAPAGRTILFVGTSLTAGLGLDPDEAYPALIASKIDSAGRRARS